MIDPIRRTPVAAAATLASDAASVASLVRAIKGPVVLVGHSFGGAVISAACNSAENVKAMGFIADRAHPRKTRVVDGASHVVMGSNPHEVAALIEEAAGRRGETLDR